MDEHDELVAQAEAAIMEVFGDDSVSREITMCSLRVLRDKAGELVSIMENEDA